MPAGKSLAQLQSSSWMVNSLSISAPRIAGASSACTLKRLFTQFRHAAENGDPAAARRRARANPSASMPCFIDIGVALAASSINSQLPPSTGRCQRRRRPSWCPVERPDPRPRGASPRRRPDRRQAGQRVHDHALAGDGHFIADRLAEDIDRHQAVIRRHVGVAKPDICLIRFAEGDDLRRAVFCRRAVGDQRKHVHVAIDDGDAAGRQPVKDAATCSARCPRCLRKRCMSHADRGDDRNMRDEQSREIEPARGVERADRDLEYRVVGHPSEVCATLRARRAGY